MDTVLGASFAFPFKDLEERALSQAADVFAHGGTADAAARRFLEQMHEDAVAEDLEDLSVDDMVFLAAGMWAWAQERPRNALALRLEPGVHADGRPMARDILEIITDDKPFLVDSVMGEINDQGGEILAMFHPIVSLERDDKGRRAASGATVCESMIQVHLAPLDEEGRARMMAGVRAALDDVSVAVADFADMRARMDLAIDELKTAPTQAPREELEECIAFLRWMRDDNFAFLGVRVYEFATGPKGELLQEEPIILDETGRGVLRDPVRNVLRRGSEPAIITPAIREFLVEPTPIIIAKSNLRSRVHRRVYMDYIGVKRYRADGEVVGETRFVGLFTATAYLARADEVPLIRRKVRRVLERVDKAPDSHSFKQLKNIVETYPRDELFQSTEDELLKISLGVLHLQDRPRAKLFIRRDRFDRFASAFVFVPRERFNSELRIKIGDLLATAFDGRLSAFYPSFSDGPLARVHFIIGLNPFDHPEPDPAELEAQIAGFTRTWEDQFERAARRHPSTVVRAALRSYSGAFAAGYRDSVGASEATDDVQAIEALSDDQTVGVRAYRRPGDGADRLRLKLYHRHTAIALSDVLPTLEAMGLHVTAESAYPVKRADDGESELAPVVYVHNFEMRFVDGEIDFERTKPALEAAFAATWDGRNESDGFNRLILSLGVEWRDVCFLRTCARYRQQTGRDPSQAVQEAAFAENPELVRMILEIKRLRFDPDYDGDLPAREAAQEKVRQEFAAAIDAVPSLDHDRVLRRVWRLVRVIQRTNFYQRDAHGAFKPAIAIKIASQELDELPEPRPYREIFVWSPQVEGVHIRFGAVARGGLRWSDRRDDFRTEVLGLVKAQRVKNAVIVPVGAKGGFYPKQLPRGGTREEIYAEGTRAYVTFVSSLLDVTDNYAGDTVVHPEGVVRWDDDDPYLVVAADKGTARFSDTANAIAQEAGFWLDDAFASGGSVGYDHKEMGITARGAWVAVQRHFRELGVDIQSQPFSVIGVGDMSGDVFGNGMLLSPVIKLVAAFDHRDIFIDPNPADLAASHAERQRLFDKDRSSWADYDPELISAGGGVFSRTEKSVPLSKEIRALTGLKGAKASPNDVINALLKAPCDLLWFGGIGTYIKQAYEQDFQVGDRSNDAVRVLAAEVGARVIGEGANLAVTQAARIALARRGVCVNADFVDNAGGVTTSDNEVNIKILLNPIVAAGRLTRPDRDALLKDMTQEVAEHVLEQSYDQTLAITLAQSTAPEDLDAYERLIGRLEGRGILDRAVEGLPTTEEFQELKSQGLGLTRPEIATLVSYAKISLFDRIVESSVPDDPYLDARLHEYFPKPLARYAEDMAQHRLRREIVATVLANDLVNLGGATFTHRARESTGADTDAVVRGFEAARGIFGFSGLIDRIHALDNVAPAEVQLALYSDVIRLLRRQTYWLVRRRFAPGVEVGLTEVIDAYKPGVDALRAIVNDVVSQDVRDAAERRAAKLVAEGAPADLAADVASLRALTSSSDVIDLARTRDWRLDVTARLYHRVGDALTFDRLRAVGGELRSTAHWDRLAVRRLIEDLYAEQQSIVDSVMAFADTVAGVKADDPALFEVWSERHAAPAARISETLSDLKSSDEWTLAKLAIATASLREFADATRVTS